MLILERYADHYFEKIITKGASKIFSMAPYCTFIAGSEQLLLTSQREIESSHCVYHLKF